VPTIAAEVLTMRTDADERIVLKPRWARHLALCARLFLVAGLCLISSAASASAAPSSMADVPTGPLSDEVTATTWAYANVSAPVRREPSAGAPSVGRLRFQTEDGFPEVYVLLRATVDAGDQTWVEVRLPQRPNGTTGWVPVEALGGFHHVHTLLVIDRHRLRATLYSHERVIWRARVGIGKPGSPTPAGRFYVREKVRFRNEPFYGPYGIGTSAYSSLTDWPGGGVVGIHGTNQPALIPGRPSHGCVRVRNAAIAQLVRRLPLGTPIQIL
jgi:hypothetical protein